MCVSEVVKAKAYDEEKMPDLNRMIGDFVKGMDADNSTMHAMQEHFTEHSDKVPEKVIPFSSTVKYSGVIFKDQAYVLGAPEFVLREDYTKYQGKNRTVYVQGGSVYWYLEAMMESRMVSR